MRIIIQDPLPGETDSVIVSVKTITERINRAINLLKSPDDLTVYAGDEALMLPVGAVFYVESVDEKTFVYGERRYIAAALSFTKSRKS